MRKRLGCQTFDTPGLKLYLIPAIKSKLSSILGMMPGMGQMKMPEFDEAEAEKGMKRTESIIYSMTTEERRNPSLLNPSRKRRIAAGASA